MKNRFGVIKISSKSIKSIKSINTAFWVYYFLIIIESAVEFIEVASIGSTTYANYISYIMFAYAVISIIFCSDSRQKIRAVGIIVFLAIFFTINIAVFSNNALYVYESIRTISLRCVPRLLLASCIIDFEDFLRKMEKYNKYMLVLSWIILILTYSGYFEDAEGYMTIAYNIMLPIGICGYLAVKNGGARRYFIFFISAVSLLFVGCRGAFIAVMILYIFSLFMLEKGKYRAKAFTIAGILFLTVFFQQIMSGIASLLDRLGYESRIITTISEGTFFQSSGRDLIRTSVMSAIRSDGFSIHGIFADRYITKLILGDSTYVHNIILEFIVDYGLIFGVIASLVLASAIIYVIRNGKYESRNAVIIFSALGLSKLFLSNSYLIDELFYCIVGLLIAAISQIRNLKVIVNYRGDIIIKVKKRL